MKKGLRKIALPIAGSLAVILFCVGATTNISDVTLVMANTFSEPLNMALLGFGLIGLGKAIR